MCCAIRRQQEFVRCDGSLSLCLWWGCADAIVRFVAVDERCDAHCSEVRFQSHVIEGYRLCRVCEIPEPSASPVAEPCIGGGVEINL